MLRLQMRQNLASLPTKQRMLRRARKQFTAQTISQPRAGTRARTTQLRAGAMPQEIGRTQSRFAQRCGSVREPGFHIKRSFGRQHRTQVSPGHLLNAPPLENLVAQPFITVCELLEPPASRPLAQGTRFSTRIQVQHAPGRASVHTAAQQTPGPICNLHTETIPV